MPEATKESRSEAYAGIKRNILQNINNLNEIAVILKNLRGQDQMPMEDRVDLMLIVFSTESETPKYDLITYLWNFLKILYNNMDKLVLRLIPAIAIDRNTELTEKQVILFKEITTRLYYVMVYMKDTSPENVEIMCKNVLLLSKYLLKHSNYSEFFSLAKESFFNPKHSYLIKLFGNHPSPDHDLFLEHFLTRLWEFREFTEEKLSGLEMTMGDLFEKFYQIFIFFVNYEGKTPQSKYPITDKLISVLLNLQLVKANKEICNSVKCLYSLIQLMKGESNQEMAAKLLFMYMGRICEKTILNSSPFAADALATIAIILEKSPYFLEEKNFLVLSLESVRYLVQTIKITLSLNVEPAKMLCEFKDCVKGAKKHTITNLTRFAQKLFVAYVGQLDDNDALDEDILAIVTQLVIFHFHVLERLTCPSRVANEHNDIRRLYSTFAHRSKAKAPASVLKIFEIVLKYVLQRNLSALLNPLATLLIKFYAEANDQSNGDRIEWINFLCKHRDSDQGTAFDNCCYNWAVKKQKLTKEELTPILLTIRDMKLDYNSELIPKNVDPSEIFLRMLESIAMLSYKAFRVLQECLVELLLEQYTTECSEEVVNLLFYATENQIASYTGAIERNIQFFESKGGPDRHIILAVLRSLQYQVYNAVLRNELKSCDMNLLLNREASLSQINIHRDNEQLQSLKISLGYLRKIASAKQLSPRQARQVVGTLKRNIRFFQLSGLVLEEVCSCKLLYDLSIELADDENALLAMANLMNHVHFIIKDEHCQKQSPHLIRLIDGEGTDLLVKHLRIMQKAKDPIQVLVVFGIGNIIKLNADLGRLEKSYEYLCMLKQKIDEVSVEKDEPNLNQMQYELISFQLFLKYASQSQVNPLMVVRKLFSAVRLLHKVSDLYALYLYDVLVELFCFSVPRYETKGLDFYICTVLKYFMGIGSVTRILDVLLVYANWALCCENLEKGTPVMEYIAEIVSQPSGDDQRKILVESKSEQFTNKVSQAITTLNGQTSVWLEIVGFKLNCLLARKCCIDLCYEESRKRYEEAWNAYEVINGRIANYQLKMEFQQFYVNALFQLSNVYYKLNMPTKSFRFCEQTTVMISDILVNRLALTQEAYFQELAFKTEIGVGQTRPIDSPVSPIRMEIAMLMNDKKVVKSSRKKVLASSSKDGTPPRSTRKGKHSAKTPAKALKIKLESPDLLHIPSRNVAVAIDENSSKLINTVSKIEEPKRRTATNRKIPVRTTTKTSSMDATNNLESKIVSSKKMASHTIPTDAVSEPVTSTRKTSRRLI